MILHIRNIRMEGFRAKDAAIFRIENDPRFPHPETVHRSGLIINCDLPLRKAKSVKCFAQNRVTKVDIFPRSGIVNSGSPKCRRTGV